MKKTSESQSRYVKRKGRSNSNPTWPKSDRPTNGHEHVLRPLWADPVRGNPAKLLGYFCGRQGCDEVFTPNGNPSEIFKERDTKRGGFSPRVTFAHVRRLRARP